MRAAAIVGGLARLNHGLVHLAQIGQSQCPVSGKVGVKGIRGGKLPHGHGHGLFRIAAANAGQGGAEQRPGLFRLRGLTGNGLGGTASRFPVLAQQGLAAPVEQGREVWPHLVLGIGHGHL